MISEKLIKNVFAQVDQMKDEVIKFTCDLVKIPTENPPGDKYEECAKFIGNKLDEFGYEVEYIDVPSDLLDQLAPEGKGLPRTNVLGRFKGTADKPVIHFNGHFDVVPAGTGWSVDPYGGVVKDGKIYGRGSSDQKSGIAAQIFAVEAVKRAGVQLKGTIEQSATVDEETGGFAGLGYLVNKGYIARSKTDYCIITECLNVNRIGIGHRGAIWFEVKTFGKKAHGCMPKRGINAIDKMVKLLNKLDRELRPNLESKVTRYPVVPEEAKHPSITPTIINSGIKLNVVPDICIAKFDRRLIPEEDANNAWDEIKAILSNLSKEDPDFNYEIKEISRVEPTIIPTGANIVRALSNAIRLVLGEEPKLILSPGFDDQRFIVQNAKIDECVVYGPGILTQAHVTDEYVLIKDIIDSTKVMALALMYIFSSGSICNKRL